MARHEFGGGSSDWVFSTSGGGLVRVTSATLTLHDAETGGSQVTDLLVGGVPATSVPVGSDGMVPSFSGPDGVTELWASAGGPRIKLVSEAGIREAAEAAKDQAVAAAANVATFGDTQDTMVAGFVADPESATGAELTAAYASRAAGIDIRTVGAVADEQTATVSITSGTNVLTRSAGSWTPTDVGKALSIPGALATPDALGRTNLPTKITGYTNASTVTLEDAATATVTNATVKYATDNQPVLQALFDQLADGGGTVIVPDVGVPFWTDMLLPKSHTRIVGPGTIKQIPRNWDDPDNSTRNGGTIMPWDGGRGTTTTTEHVIVEGLRIDGNKGSHYGAIANRTNGEGINFKYGRQCAALHNVIWDVDGDGIDFDYTEGSLALGNYIENASGWGIHHSDGNKNNRLIGNQAVLCGWDQYTDSGVSAGGFDCSLNTTDITYIGNVADGCRINLGFGSSGYDPAVYRLIAVGNRSLSNAATPALSDSFNAVLATDLPTSFPSATSFGANVTVNGVLIPLGSVQMQRAGASNVVLDSKVEGDSTSRLSVRANGAIFFGPGNAAHDVALLRGAADRLDLTTGDSFKLDGTWNGGHLLFGTSHLWRDSGGLWRAKDASAPTSDTDGNIIGGGVLTGTTANFAVASNSRNTTGKYAGRMCWNTSLGRPIWATGSAATDTWVFADGTTAHTPT